jgi:hypothetical protein
MVGIRSPDGLVVGSCTSHPGVLGSILKREEPGKTGRHPVLMYRVPHGSQPRPGWAPDPLMVEISCDGNPVVDVHTGARHADGWLGGLWNRHVLEGYPQQ